MDFFSLPDASSGHLDNCPLEEVLLHEFGHWVVAQECDIRPNGIAVYGIVWTESTAVVTRGAEVPFSASCGPRAEEAAMYAADVVAEHLSRGAFDPEVAARVLAEDASCAYDFMMAVAIAEMACTSLRRGSPADIRDGSASIAVSRRCRRDFARAAALSADTPARCPSRRSCAGLPRRSRVGAVLPAAPD